MRTSTASPPAAQTPVGGESERKPSTPREEVRRSLQQRAAARAGLPEMLTKTVAWDIPPFTCRQRGDALLANERRCLRTLAKPSALTPKCSVATAESAAEGLSTTAMALRPAARTRAWTSTLTRASGSVATRASGNSVTCPRVPRNAAARPRRRLRCFVTEEKC